jgi:glycerol-3-phosphate dehydrogenase
MKKSLAIIGAGAWGSALAIALSKEFEKIFLITKDKANTKGLGNQHEALSVPFNSNISIGNSFEVIEESQAVLIATPSSSFNIVLKNLIQTMDNSFTNRLVKNFLVIIPAQYLGQLLLQKLLKKNLQP